MTDLIPTELVYTFSGATDANRFVNSLKYWSQAEVVARLYRDDHTVMVCYHPQHGGFDDTSAKLDDLAARYGGYEA